MICCSCFFVSIFVVVLFWLKYIFFSKGVNLVSRYVHAVGSGCRGVFLGFKHGQCLWAAGWVRVGGWSGGLRAWPHPQCQDQEALFEALQILHRGTFQFPAWSRGTQMSTLGEKVRKQQRTPLRMQTRFIGQLWAPHLCHFHRVHESAMPEENLLL